MLVGVSTGVLHDYIGGINRKIRFFRKSGLEIDGLELSFGSQKGLERLKLAKENEEYVRQLKFNSIHLPWTGIVYSEKETACIRVLSELYRRLNSNLAVIHPDCVKSREAYVFLQDFFPNLAVENMTPKKSIGHSVEDIRKIISYNAKLGVVLDFAHCMESKEPFEAYEKAFSNRIAEIHISASKKALYKDETGSSHIVLHKTDILPVIRKRDIPLIIEGKLSTPEDLKNEINFAKRL